MKKLKVFLATLTSATLLALSASPISAGIVQSGAVDSSKLPSGTLIYSETFDGADASDTDAALAALNWEKCENLREFTAQFSIVGGKLHIDNLDATVGTSNDSYAVMMSSDYLAKVCNSDYTYQYEVTYLDAENNSRYVSLLCNYDYNNNYNTVDMRIRGDGYNQVRKGDSWIWYNDTICPLRATDDTSIVTQLFGETFDSDGYHLKGRTITVRVETSIENGPSMYVNGILVSTMQDHTEEWNTIDSYAMCFKASKMVAADIDNIMVWTGLDDEPIIPVAEEAPVETASESESATSESATPDAVVSETSSETASAPATFDAMLPTALAAVFSAAVMLGKKRRK